MPNPIKVQAEAVFVNKVTDSLVEYLFKPKGRIPAFRPGQFLHLAIDDYDPSFDWPESRVFSIANGSKNTKYIRIIVSVKGIFTKRMYETIHKGNYVWLKMAYGNFLFDNNDSSVVFIAGGTGVAPFISYLDDALLNDVKRNISLFYGVRNPNLMIIEKELIEYNENLKNFNYKVFIEEGELVSNINMTYGKPCIADIFANCNHLKPMYYISGPWNMVDNFYKYLLNNNVENYKIIIDEWE